MQIQLNKSPVGLAPADAASLQFDPPLLPGTTRPKRDRLRAGDAKMQSQVPAMTAEATERLVRACAPLRVAQASSALKARIDELLARRESLA